MTNAVLVCHSGWWWPADDQDARPVIVRDCEPSIAALLPHVAGRELIIQAGGNVGIYAVALAKLFAHVLTTEPDPVNYECLCLNVEAHHEGKGRITFPPHPAAFGEVAGTCAPLVVQAHNCGAHRVAFDTGSIQVLTIDEMCLPACDCIWLDVEGSELPALKGAEQTIEQFSPTIAVEDKSLHRAFGIPDGALQAWLAERGYAEVARIGNDKIFRRRTI